MADQQPPEGWSEYRRLVLDTLTDVKTRLEKIQTAQNDSATEMAVLKTKVAFWSAGLATLVSLAAQVIAALFKGH